MIRLTVQGVAVDDSEQHVLVLEDAEDRALLVEVNRWDAHLLSLGHQGEKLNTPMFFDLVKDICSITGCKLERVLITGLNGDVFETKIELTYNEKQVLLDVRLTDAVLLALDNGLPIFMDAKLEEHLIETPPIKDADGYYLN